MKQALLIAIAALLVGYTVYTLGVKPSGNGAAERPNTVNRTPGNGNPTPDVPDNTALPRATDVALDTVPGGAFGRFNLDFDLRFDRPNGVARVAFNRSADGRAAYLLDFSAEGIGLSRLQNGGFEQPLSNIKAPLFEPGRNHQVTVKRRRLQTTILVDGRIALRHEDGALSDGLVAAGMPAGAGRIDNVTLTPVLDIFDQDDFMRDPTSKQGNWRPVSGSWDVAIPDFALRSANAFQYVVTGDGENLSVMGEPWWDDYLVETAFSATRADAAGLAFYYRENPGNEPSYYLLRWTPRQDATPVLQLIRVLNGQREVLASKSVGYLPGHWYALQVRVLGDFIEASVSGHKVFEVRDPYLQGGAVGLYASNSEHCAFDSVYVRSLRSFGPAVAANLDTWSPVGEGKWRADAAANALTANPNGGLARLARGAASWRNYNVSAEISPAGDGLTGISIAYRTPIDHHQLEIDTRTNPARAALVRVAGGQRVELASIELPELAEPLPLVIRMFDRYIGVTHKGQTILEAYDDGLRGGGISLFSEGTGTARFANVTLEFPDEAPPQPNQSAAFRSERTMDAWNSDWERIRSPLGLASAHIHKQDFMGSETFLTAKVARLGDGDGVGLALGCGENSFDGSYRMTLRGGERWTVELARGDETVKTVEVPAHVQAACEPRLRGIQVDLSQEFSREQLEGLIASGESLHQTIVPGFDLRFERVGSGMFLGFVNDVGVISWRDPDPLEGPRPGHFAIGQGAFDEESITVANPLIANEDFRTAPVNWRTQHGVWTVTPRWECDPRWTFFSGHCRREDFNENPLVAIWHKREFVGDMSVDFYVGPMMLRQTLGDYDGYVRDFNVTIAADGRDISSGYSFQFGAEGNKVTRILRGNEVVAQTTRTTIPVRNIHRQWFHIKARKQGDTVELFIDGEKVLDYTDPNPLTGRRVAIWTWNSAIMLSRVRIIAEELGPMEPLDFEPSETSQTVYTGKPVDPQLRLRGSGPIRPDDGR